MAATATATDTTTGEQRMTLLEMMEAEAAVEAMFEQAAAAGDDVTSDMLERALGAQGAQIEAKVERVLAVMAKFAAREVTQKAWAKQLTELAKRAENEAKRLRDFLQYALQQGKRDKVQTALGTVSLTKPAVDLGPVDDQAAFEAGLGECTLTIQASADNVMRTLARAALKAAADGARITLSVTVTTRDVDRRDAWSAVADDCGEPVRFSYAADKQSLTERALLDLSEQAEYETLLEVSGGETVPPPPDPTIPAGVCCPQWKRTLQVRGLK